MQHKIHRDTKKKYTEHKHTQWAWEEKLTCITHNTEKEKNGLNFSKRHSESNFCITIMI